MPVEYIPVKSASPKTLSSKCSILFPVTPQTNFYTNS